MLTPQELTPRSRKTTHVVRVTKETWRQTALTSLKRHGKGDTTLPAEGCSGSRGGGGFWQTELELWGFWSHCP